MGNTVSYFEMTRGKNPFKFEIEKITDFSESEMRVKLKTTRAYHDRSREKPTDLWLYFGHATYYSAENCKQGPVEYDDCDSMRFLFFLMEHYIFNGSKKNVFDTSSSEAIKAWLREYRLYADKVKEWITESKPTYGLINPAIGDKFRLTCGIT